MMNGELLEGNNTLGMLELYLVRLYSVLFPILT